MKNILLFEENSEGENVLPFLQGAGGMRTKKRRVVAKPKYKLSSDPRDSEQTQDPPKKPTVPVVKSKQDIKQATKKELPKLKKVIDKRPKPKLKAKIEKRAAQIAILNKKGKNKVDQQRAKQGKTPGISDSGAGTGGGTGTEQDYRNQIGTLFGLEFSSNCMNKMGTGTAALLSLGGMAATVLATGYATATWPQVKFLYDKTVQAKQIIPKLRNPGLQSQRAAIVKFSEEVKKLKSSLSPELKVGELSLTNIKQRLWSQQNLRTMWPKIKSTAKVLVQTGNVAMVGALLTWAFATGLKKMDAIGLSQDSIDALLNVVILMKFSDQIAATLFGYSMLDIDSGNEEQVNCAMMFSIIGIAFALTLTGILLSKGKASPREFSKLFQANLSKYNGEFSAAFRKTFIERTKKIIDNAKKKDAEVAQKLEELRRLLTGSGKTKQVGEGGYNAALKHVQETSKYFNDAGKNKAIIEFELAGQKMLDELDMGYKVTVKQFQAVAKATHTNAKLTASTVNAKIESNFAAIQKQIQPPAGNLPLKNPFASAPVVPAVSRNIDYSKVSQVVAETESLFFRGDPLAAINLSRKIGKQFMSTVAGKENKILRRPDALTVLKILKGIDRTRISSNFDTNALRTLLKTLKELKGAPGAPLRMQSLSTQEVAAAYLDDLIFFKFPNFPKAAKRELIRISQLVSRQADDAAKQVLPAKLPANLSGRVPLYLGFATVGVVLGLTSYYVYGGDPIDDVPGAPTEFNGLLPDEVNAYMNSISGTRDYKTISNRLKSRRTALRGALQVVFSEGGDKFNKNYENSPDGIKDLDALIDEIADAGTGRVGSGQIPDLVNEILVKFATIKQDALIDYAVSKMGMKMEIFGDGTSFKDPKKYARSQAAQHLIINILVFKSALREKLKNYYSNVHNTSLLGKKQEELRRIFTKNTPDHLQSIQKSLKAFDGYYSQDKRKEVDKKIEKLRQDHQKIKGGLFNPDIDWERGEQLPKSLHKTGYFPKRSKGGNSRVRDLNLWELVQKEQKIQKAKQADAIMSPLLKMAQFYAESQFKKGALSNKNARGLAQIIPSTEALLRKKYKDENLGDIAEVEDAIKGSFLHDRDATDSIKRYLKQRPSNVDKITWQDFTQRERDKLLLYSYHAGAPRFQKYIINSQTKEDIFNKITNYYKRRMKVKGSGVNVDYAEAILYQAGSYGYEHGYPSGYSTKQKTKSTGRPRLNLQQRLDQLKRRGLPRLKPRKTNEVQQMSKKNIKELVTEMLNENSGQGYAPYPYGSSVRDDEQPKQDYVEEWKAFSLELVRDQSRNMAIEVAKLLVKDLELFEDVLDLAGQNQSIGEEILQKLKDSKQA